MSKSLQQGQADGLCGIYCILNFLMTLDEWRKHKPTEAMEYVLQAALAEGVLGPSWITGGYRSTEIKSILNRIFDQEWMPYRAAYLSEIRPQMEDTYKLYGRILEQGGSVIGGSDKRDHWLLFTIGTEGPVVISSSDRDHATRSFNGRLKSLCSADSVAVVRFERPVVEIGI